MTVQICKRVPSKTYWKNPIYHILKHSKLCDWTEILAGDITVVACWCGGLVETSSKGPESALTAYYKYHLHMDEEDAKISAHSDLELLYE